MSNASKRATTRHKKRPTGIFARGNVLWGRYKNAQGTWQSVSLGLRVGQEAEAAELLTAIKRQVKAGREVGLQPGEGRPTFQRFFGWWIERRKDRRLRAWCDDDSRIRTHVIDMLGPMKLDEVTPLDLEKVFLRMRDRGRAPKTVWNAYSAVRAMFRDAAKKGFIRQSPCVLGEEELGPMVDKDPEWRETAIFSRDEVASLMFDPRVPIDRRLFYSITYLAGRRLGETSGLRIRHLDLNAEPLGAIIFARSYARDRTKTNATIRMPAHPVLADILRAWLTTGFREMFGRDPQPDDFVVPRPPQCRSKFGPSRDKNYVRKQLLKDLDALDLRLRRTHDLRRSFISHAQQDGAQRDKLIRLTHPSEKKATAFAGYTEFSWIEFCIEVAKLNVAIPKPASAPAQPLALAIGQSEPTSTSPSSPTTSRPSRPQLVTVLATPKEKALEDPGLSQWRRRESNPGPEAIKQGFYVCSRYI